MEELVDIALTNSNIEYFESVGYEIPRRVDSQGRLRVARGTKIKVKVQHLTRGSATKVTRICDSCTRESKIPFNAFSHVCVACRLKERVGEKHPTWIGPIRCLDCGSKVHWGSTRCKTCYGKHNSGSNNPNYKVDRSERAKQRDRKHETVKWAMEVKERDNYTCQKCGARDGRELHSHHLNSWAAFPEQRHSLENGVTLCRGCHFEFHDQYGRRYNTSDQFKRFKEAK